MLCLFAMHFIYAAVCRHLPIYLSAVIARCMSFISLEMILREFNFSSIISTFQASLSPQRVKSTPWLYMSHSPPCTCDSHDRAQQLREQRWKWAWDVSDEVIPSGSDWTLRERLNQLRRLQALSSFQRTPSLCVFFSWMIVANGSISLKRQSDVQHLSMKTDDCIEGCVK